MANICENRLFLSTENKKNYKFLVGKIEKLFECYNISEHEGDKSCEIDFESRWTFPDKIFQELTDEIGLDDSLYIRVLSYEFGCDYVGYNAYQNNEWIDKLNQ